MATASDEERSLPPSARRIEQAERAGQIAISRDAIAALSYASVWLVLGLSGATVAAGLVAYVHSAMARATAETSVAAVLREGGANLLATLACPLVVAVAGAALAGLAQTRGRLRAPIWGDNVGLRMPSPGVGMERARAARTLADLAKMLALLAVAGVSLRRALATCALLPHATTAQGAHALVTWFLRAGSHLALAMIVLGVADYGWRWRRQRLRLRMSPHQARREERESEGDPDAKSERRRLHRELSLAAADVLALAGADLVLTEPGTAAAAVAWRAATGGAPRLIAKGTGLRARRIEARARELGLSVFVEPAMVRALGLCEEGSLLPSPVRARLSRIAGLTKVRPRTDGKDDRDR